VPWLAAALFVVAVVLGVWGFGVAAPESTWPTRVYWALQLGAMESGAMVESLPWMLELARWLAPLALFWGAIHVAWGWILSRWCLFAAERAREHVLVIGLGRKGSAFVRALFRFEARHGITALDVDDTIADAAVDLLAAGREQCRSWRVLCGDGRQAEALDACAARHARRIFILTDSDQTNLAVLGAVLSKTVASDSAHGCRVYVHIADATLRRALQRQRPSMASVEVRYQSHFGNLARRILLLWPLEEVDATGATDVSKQIHLLVIGDGPLQRSLIQEAAAIGHYLGDRRVHVHLVGVGVRNILERLELDVPAIRDCVACLDGIEALDGCEVRQALTFLSELPPQALVTVLPQTAEPSRMYADALQLRESYCEAKLRVLLPVASLRGGQHRSPLDAGMHEIQRDGGLHGSIAYFDEEAVLEECALDSFDGKSDGLAAVIHAQWLDRQHREAEVHEREGRVDRARKLRSKDTFRPWTELSEAQRTQSHVQATHSFIKLRAANRSVESLSADAPVDEACLEALARMEHERWVACQRLAGWKPGAVRDDVRRIHTDLVPFEQLSDATRGYDRDAVRNLFRLKDALQEELASLEQVRTTLS
jgi:hypothetical protein